MKKFQKQQLATIINLYNAALANECLSINALRTKYKLKRIGGAVGDGKKLHSCPKSIINRLESDNIMSTVSTTVWVNLYSNPFSDSFGCWSRSWAGAEALRSTWVYKMLGVQIKKCKNLKK